MDKIEFGVSFMNLLNQILQLWYNSKSVMISDELNEVVGSSVRTCLEHQWFLE